MRGFTILELMVALGLASIGSMAIFGVMRGQLQAHYDQARVGDAQANGRLALDFIVQRIEATGFGIPSSLAMVTTNVDNALGGDVANTWPGTDVFEVRARDPRGTRLATAASTTASLSLYPLTAGIADVAWPFGQRLMIYRSQGQVATARTKGVRAVNGTTVVLDPVLSSNFPTAPLTLDKTEAYMINVSRFRIVATDVNHPTLVLEDDTDINGDSVIDQNDALPIANDIEDLQVSYFQDTDSNNVLDATELAAPLTATAVTDWTKVKAIRVTVVARSANQGAPKNSVSSQQVVVENHTPSTATDYYFRRTMRETVFFDNINTASPAYQHLSNLYL